MSEEGKLFDYANLDRVDDWSRSCYASLSNWDLARSCGKWSTWDGKPYYQSNYLLLEIVVPDSAGIASEPLVIYTADEELTVGSRIWHEHYPDFEQKTDEQVAATIKLRTQRWFDGLVRAAVFFHGNDWRGTGIIEDGDDVAKRLEDLRSDFSRHFELDRVELRGPWPAGDAVFEVTRKRVIM